MSVTIARCGIDTLWSDARFACVASAYADEGAYSGMPTPQPSRDAYRSMEQRGFLAVMRVDRDGALVGFATLVLTVSPHYGVPIAVIESVFVMPEHRGAAGARLVRAIIETARTSGAHTILATAPIGSRLGRMLAKIGFAPTSTTYQRRLQ
jgi:GNAT superfamily N-acetyltransferase